jgi:acyl-CoA synthetase (NDP forming)
VPAAGTAPASPLDRMLRPRAIALVGVSGRPESLNARPLRYLREHGFAGAVHPVNPGYAELQGLPCHASLLDVPGPVDLVLSMVPAASTAEVVRQAGAVGAAGVIVFASGFAESGPVGAALQAEMIAAAQEAGVRLLGPNCQGLIHAPSGLSATFTAAADRTLDGGSGVAYVGQSGAVGGSVLDLASEMGLGLTAWVSTGNQADLDLVEVAAAVLEDDAVRVLMLYTEVIPDGEAYELLARRARDAGKHLVVLLSGRSDAGRRAAASHTGSMLGDDTAFVLASEEYGVTLVDDVDEMLAVAAMVDHVRRVEGRRVGVITTSGGAGSLAADQCAQHDLSLPEIGAAGQVELAAFVPDFGALSNPVDVTAQLFNREGSAHALGRVCTIVAEQPDIDVIAVVLTMVTGELGAQLAEDLVATAERLEKPLFVVWLAGREQTVRGRQVFRQAGMPVFDSVGDFARTAGLLAPRAAHAVGEAPGDEEHLGAGVAAGTGASAELWDCLVGDRAADDLLRALGIASPSTTLATSAEETVAAARARRGPVAVKLQAVDLAHKSDLGGVRLGVTVAEAADAFDALMKVASDHGVGGVEGVTVQEMIPPGVELIIGVTSAADGYPPVVTVGIGGVTTELYRDVASALAPVTPHRAVQLMRTLRGWPLLDGFRGAAPADVRAAAEAVASVSRAAAGLCGRAFEFEINPLIVAADGDGAHAVDLLATTVAGDTTDQHNRQET